MAGLKASLWKKLRSGCAGGIRAGGRGGGHGADIPAIKCLAVLVAGQVPDQTFDHRGGIAVTFGQIDQRATENDLAASVELAGFGGFPIFESEKACFRLSVSLLGAF